MGCLSSKPVDDGRGAGTVSRNASSLASRRPPKLGRNSLAVAALPPPVARTVGGASTRDGGGRSSSSSEEDSDDDDASISSSTSSGGGSMSESREILGGDPEEEAGLDTEAPGAEQPGGGGSQRRLRALASIVTTSKLRVGVLEGTTFLNQYIVVDTLGRGSYGKVKLCLNTGDDTLYAVKVVNTKLLRAAHRSRLRMRSAPAGGAGGPQGLAAAGDSGADLRREVDVMRALSHPNLVKLFEVIDDREGGKVLMVMEYAEAGALVGPNTLTPDRHLPEAMAQFYFRQMAAGLAYLHENHVVHGDMKPENVMLSGNGTVKIGDFGQSQFFDRRDTFNRTLGTPAYLAPEICAGESYRGRQADVWALGVSLYLFIFGELPFRGESVLDLYDAVATQEVPYPRHRPISYELQDLFLRLLHKDPQFRMSSAEVLQHPWVSGSAWMALMPGMPPAVEASPACQDLKASTAHPLASFIAEEVAAVVFPEMQDAELAGSSPRSPGGGSSSGGMQIVDALAAASASGGGEARAASRLAHGSPGQRLDQLSQDSMIQRGWENVEVEEAPTAQAAAAGAAADALPPHWASGVVGGSSSLAGSSAALPPGASSSSSLAGSSAALPPGASSSSSRQVSGRSTPVGAAAGLGGDRAPAGGTDVAVSAALARREEAPQASADGSTELAAAMWSSRKRAAGSSGSLGGSGGAAMPPTPEARPAAPVIAAEDAAADAAEEGSGGQQGSGCGGVGGGGSGPFQHPPLPQAAADSKQGARTAADHGRQLVRPSPFSLAVTPAILVPRRQAGSRSRAASGGAATDAAGHANGCEQPAGAQQKQQGRRQQEQEHGRDVAPSDPPGREQQHAIRPPRQPAGEGEAAGAGSPGAAWGCRSQTPGCLSAGRSLSSLSILDTGSTPPGPSAAIWGGGGGSAESASKGKPGRRSSFGSLRGFFAGPADFMDPLPYSTRHSGDGYRNGAFSAPAAAGLQTAGSAPLPPGPEAAAASDAAGGGVASSAASSSGARAGRRLRNALFVGPADLLQGAAAPPRPPPKPTAQQPIVINRFKAGEKVGAASTSNQQQTCFYIEQGVIEVRYEADIPVTLSSVLSAAFPAGFFRRTATAPLVTAVAAATAAPPTSPMGPAAAAHRRTKSQGGATGVGGPGAGLPDANLAAEDKADSSVHGSHVFDLGVAPELALPPADMAGRGKELMERCCSLAETVRHATSRAEALISSAKAGSLDHLLVCERTGGDFLGSLAMLDPHFFMGRWKATAVAKTPVVLVHMTRQGLETFLQQNPLAQVRLRASMARARSEVVKLEALERIASAGHHQLLCKRERTRTRRSGGGTSGRRQGLAAPAEPAEPAVPAVPYMPAAPPISLSDGRAELPPTPPEAAPAAASIASAAAPGGAQEAADHLAAVVPEASADAVGAAPAAVRTHPHIHVRTRTHAHKPAHAHTHLHAHTAPGGISSATLELFSVVSRLRAAISEGVDVF